MVRYAEGKLKNNPIAQMLDGLQDDPYGHRRFEVKLEPCITPYCNGSVNPQFADEECNLHYVECGICDARGPIRNSEEGAAKEWNHSRSIVRQLSEVPKGGDCSSQLLILITRSQEAMKGRQE